MGVSKNSGTQTYGCLHKSGKSIHIMVNIHSPPSSLSTTNIWVLPKIVVKPQKWMVKIMVPNPMKIHG